MWITVDVERVLRVDRGRNIILCDPQHLGRGHHTLVLKLKGNEMPFVKIKSATANFSKPSNWDEKSEGSCGDLWVRVDRYGARKQHNFAWKPDASDLAILNAGGEIEVHIVNDYMPPVGVSAVKPDKQQAPPDGTERDLSTVEKRNAFYSSDEYRSMTTAEKCAVQPDGFINDYD